MNIDLKQRVEEIYKNHSPLANVDKQLIQRRGQTDFRQNVEQNIQDLESKEQQRILDEFFDWGPLVPLLNRQGLFDIIIQGPEHIFYEDASGLHRWTDQFLSKRSFQNFTELLQKEAQLLVNQKDPYGNGSARGFRVHMVTPPIAKSTAITLRKHNDHIFKLASLEEQEFLSPHQGLVVRDLIMQRKNLLIVGPTGSGKTTFLNSLLDSIPDNQRAVIIEDTDEIITSSPLACKLLAREVCPQTLSEVPMQELVKQSLRMRPDRIVVGEVRGSEAKDLLQALSTGHSGSIGTLHADNAKQALIRLEMLIQMGAPQWSLHSIRQLIQMSLDYLIVLKEDRGKKGVKEICKVGSHEKFGILLETLKEPDLNQSDSLNQCSRFLSTRAL